MTPNDIAKRIIFLLLLLIAFNVAWKRMAPHPLGNSVGNKAEALSKESFLRADESGKLLSAIAEHASNSVVSIRATGTQTMVSFWGQPIEMKREARGTGIIAESEGLIVTNAHLVAGYEEIFVKLKDGREFEASFTAYDTMYDIAVVKIEKDSLPACDFLHKGTTQPGEWILAIGNPMGLDHSVTFGIISGTGRTDTLANGISIDYIQTDAAINQGNSGGPLVNLDGQVVGMTSFILSPSGGSAGVGFAIPTKKVLEIAGKLKQTKLRNLKN